MPLDTSIALQARPVQLQNPVELAQSAATLRQLGLQGQASQLGIEQAQRNLAQEKTLADLYRNNTDPTTGKVNQQGVISGMASAGLGEKIPAYQKSISDASKSQTDQQTAEFELHKKKLDMLNGGISSLLSKPDLNHDDVVAQINNFVNQGLITPEQGAEAARNTPGRPEQLRPFLIQKGMEAMDVSKQLEARIAMAPKYNAQDTGAAINQGTVDPLSGQRTAGANVAKTVSADTTANIAKDYAVAGLNPDGSLKPADASLVDQIGQNRVIPSARLQATPRGQAILAAVEAKYPGYDITTAEAKQKAAKDFTTGKEGASMRSIGTATKHLDMLDGIVDALGNGNTNVLNRLGQAWSTQTGGTAPTNFDAAKEIVGQEVIKAIVAGGGGVAERAEAAASLDKAKSPAQLKGVIQTYKSIMGAQHESLLQQRRAAGLSDSTLPDYTEGSASGAAPGSQSGPPAVPIKSDADYAGLKSGTRFQAPDGSIRVKP